MAKLNEDDPLVKALIAEAEGHESLAKAARLRAAAAQADRHADDQLLDVDQALAEFGVGRDGLKNAADRGELTLSRGSRRKLLITRSELRRWLAARPYKGPTKAQAATEGFDALDAELQRGGLVRGAR